jgi:zinc finger CCCH domain-containing protein 13
LTIVGNDNPRKEREERARSRQRDASRSRTEASRRDRAPDREDDDDSRHWRDDGKRDDRVASRRTRDKQGGDHWEPPNDRERRWPANEERDGRTKRTNGRDRRAGADDVKDREDRRDREKEKEPAWMDSSVPSEPLPGILGGKASNGELDGIQAWKKGIKDKEKQEKEKAVVDNPPPEQGAETQPTSNAPQMDEIQLFRLMMQKEQGKLGSDKPADSPSQSKPAESPLPSSALGQGPRTSDPSQDPFKPLTVAPAVLTSPLPSHADGVQTNSQFVPPPGSRLLALGRGPAKPPPATEVTVEAPAPLSESWPCLFLTT